MLGARPSFPPLRAGKRNDRRAASVRRFNRSRSAECGCPPARRSASGLGERATRHMHAVSKLAIDTQDCRAFVAAVRRAVPAALVVQLLVQDTRTGGSRLQTRQRVPRSSRVQLVAPEPDVVGLECGVDLESADPKALQRLPVEKVTAGCVDCNARRYHETGPCRPRIPNSCLQRDL